MYVCVYDVSIYVCTDVYIYPVHECVHTNVCVHSRMYVRTYTCVRAFVHDACVGALRACEFLSNASIMLTYKTQFPCHDFDFLGVLKPLLFNTFF